MNEILAPQMEENPKVFWRYIKSLKRDNVGIPTLRSNGELISDSGHKAEVLNNYLQSVFTQEDSTSLPDLGNSPFPEFPIFNQSLTTSTLPKDWQTAFVNPLFKKGKRTDPGL